MSGLGLVVVGIGAALGAWLRWGLGLLLNAAFPPIPPGTVLANLIGGYVIGAAIGFFSQAPGIASEWRLLIVTGFCGGLTTFSTFSAEIVGLAQQGRLGMMAGAIGVHVGGSVAMTLLGLASMQWVTAR
ncbi:MAG: fluoride efflux transporter CrcB [Variovorax paradoxus]|nr:MAG: fluoride efflux transporter CrcB [Variovorax paradoxus]PZQ00834.1 MAG: fluoride efflux transporter CrcB [Variovorax paradoxus]